MHEPPYRIKNMVPGMIMLWYGSIATIPSGWHECDGTVGTPDLRSKFVRAAHPALPPGTAGGSDVHTHDFTGDGHAHLLPAGPDIAAGSDFDKDTNSAPAVGTTDSGSNVPAYHCLAYIMKL